MVAEVDTQAAVMAAVAAVPGKYRFLFLRKVGFESFALCLQVLCLCGTMMKRFSGPQSDMAYTGCIAPMGVQALIAVRKWRKRA